MSVDIMRIVVAYSPAPRQVDTVELELAEGATVHDALNASLIAERHPGIDLSASRLGLWGARCSIHDILRDGDRVEIYRPLRVDPNEARLQRHKRQRALAKGG